MKIEDFLLILSRINIILPTLLWAVPIALYISLAFLMSSSFSEMEVRIEKFFPRSIRSTIAPLLLGAFLGCSMVLGPLWCMILWSGAIAWLLGQRTLLRVLSIILLSLMGGEALRHAGESFLSDQNLRNLLELGSSVQPQRSASELRYLVDSRPRDYRSHLLLAEALMIEGRFVESDQAIRNALRLSPENSRVIATKGALSYLQGDLVNAEKIFDEAEHLGLSDAVFFFNRSRIRFEALDTVGSKQYLTKASALNRDLVVHLQNLEEQNPRFIGFIPVTGRWESFIELGWKWLESVRAEKFILGIPGFLCLVIACLSLFASYLPETYVHRTLQRREIPLISVRWMTMIIRYFPGGGAAVRGDIGGAFLWIVGTLLTFLPFVPNAEIFLKGRSVSVELAIGGGCLLAILVVYEMTRDRQEEAS